MNIGISKITLSLAICALPFTFTACGGDSTSVDPQDIVDDIALSSSEAEGSSSSKEGNSSSADKDTTPSSQDSTSQDSSSSAVDSPESSSSEETFNSESFTDSRDGKTYKLTEIGTQIWMAEDLKYGDSSLYVFADAETVCPEGFHLPSSKEFKTLVAYVGGEDVAGQKLKSTTGWPNMPEYDNWNGTDEFGFNAKPVESGNGTGTDENFWTSTHDFANYSTIVFFKFDPHPTSKVDSSAPQSEFGSTIPFCIGEQNTSPTRTCFVNGEPDTRLSIRCLSNVLKCGNKYIDYTQQFCQDDVAYDVCYGHQYDGQKYNCVDGVIRDRSTDSVYKPSWMLLNSEKEYGLFLDTRDGQFYKTIDIDGVVWFAENLNYALEGSLCFENNQYYCDIYGRLYTQKQVLDEGDSIPTGYWQGICPPGSHVSTYDEYYTVYQAYSYNDLTTTYKFDDFYDNYAHNTNETGLSITFPGIYPPSYSTYELEWDNLNYDAYYIGSDYTHIYTRDWISRNLSSYPHGEREINDTKYGSVRCVVD